MFNIFSEHTVAAETFEAFDRHKHVLEFTKQLETWSEKDREMLLRTMLDKMPIVTPASDGNKSELKIYKPVLSRMKFSDVQDGMRECSIHSCTSKPDEVTEGDLVIYAVEQDPHVCATDQE